MPAPLILVALLLAAGTSAADGPSYVGAGVCAPCHEAEHRRWTGSHHDLAMQEANEQTVLGDFGGSSLRYHGVPARFFRRDGTYFIHSEGPDGVSRDYQVRYTFGAHPLQQYLIALPGGRLQAHNLAWDARPREAGGQRWFHLHPAERIPPGDVLHWTGPAQNWNRQCAECHSTNVRKHYDVEAKDYETSWSEIDVACEACHGPGSAHVAWATAPGTVEARSSDKGLTVQLGDAKPATWSMDAETGIARRSRPRDSDTEIETCAPCHSRRAIIDAPLVPGRPYLAAHRPALLDPGLYHADGQIDDEVYVYGSFLQSKMFGAGVTCSDCHDPHGLALGESPDAVCATCHMQAKFDTPAHHFHPPGSKGSSCVECHMPSKVYMVVDARRDHGFRVPRPDLSVELGMPDACTGCHTDKDAQWAADAVTARHGGTAARPTFARALHAGRRVSADASRLLVDLAGDAAQPAIARATGLSLLERYATPAVQRAIVAGLSDPDPLVRMAAAGTAASLGGRAIPVDRLFELLTDAERAVRIEAGRTLAPLLGGELPPDRRTRLEHALDEYRRAQRVNADRPEAHVNLGLLSLTLGDTKAAERHYRTALEVGSYFIPAHVNLADLLRAGGQDSKGEGILRKALGIDPESADVHYALGLLLVRTGRQQAAMQHLQKASTNTPDDPHYAYVYGVALHSAGDTKAALAVLRANHQRHDGHVDTLLALATISRDAGAAEEALAYAERLQALDPSDPRPRALLEELRARPTR